MKKWEYKFHYQGLMKKLAWTKNTGVQEYKKNLKETEKEINKLAKDGWELFSSHVTAFNMLVFILRREKK